MNALIDELPRALQSRTRMVFPHISTLFDSPLRVLILYFNMIMIPIVLT
jgi:hypothetical protein